MRKTLISVLAAVALLLGGGYLLNSSAAHADTPISTRGWCIKSGSGELRNLWLTADGKCPTYSPTNSYWGPVSLGGGAPGPAGPQGPKGDSGDSAIKVVSKTVVLNSSSPATQTVVLEGLPAKVSGLLEVDVNSAGSAPAGTTVSVAPLGTATGSTQRQFTVGVSGFAGSATFTLSIKVLSIPA